MGAHEGPRSPSAVEQLPQHVVHWLILLRRRRRRSRGAGGAGARCWPAASGVGRARLWPCRALKSCSLPWRLWLRPCWIRLPRVLPEIAAERIGRPLPGADPLPPGNFRRADSRRAVSARRVATEQIAAQSAERAVRPEQALAHLLQLGIGGVRIVEDAGHVRIDARLGPRAVDHHGDAEPDRIGGAALALRSSSRASARSAAPATSRRDRWCRRRSRAPAGRPD